VRDGGAYGCAVPRAYANLNPGLQNTTPHYDQFDISQHLLIIFGRNRPYLVLN